MLNKTALKAKIYRLKTDIAEIRKMQIRGDGDKRILARYSRDLKRKLAKVRAELGRKL